MAAQNRTELRGSFLGLSKGKATKFARTRGFSTLTRFRNTENLVTPLFLDMDVVKTLSITSLLVVFPRFLTPYRPMNTTSRDPYPPSSRDPRDPLPAATPPPLRSLGRGIARGPAWGRGSRPVALSDCGRSVRGNTTSRDPLSSRDPLPLLKGFEGLPKFFTRDVRTKDPGTSAGFPSGKLSRWDVCPFLTKGCFC